ncbi:unnamed protein product [Brachionus calyciflorus]|uniref:Uncharacterized protein n=1 Tax=Brachionus calyciflorus TaxID=104777 RepID=A0A814C2Z0_9BILA|nr:unnamed protein product [Brachionus calyciflorus]
MPNSSSYILCLNGYNYQAFNLKKFKYCYNLYEPNLQKLFIKSFKFEKITYDFNFIHRTIRYFEIEESNLELLPNISRLHLNFVRLNNNQLKRLDNRDLMPNTIEFLNLKNNQIEFIKSDFFIMLTKLKELFLNNNKKLKSINYLIFNSKQFYLLKFDNNQIEKFDEINFLAEPNEETFEINFHNNRLQKIPYFTGKIKKFKKILLGYQHLSDILYTKDGLKLDKEDKPLYIKHFWISLNLFRDWETPIEYYCLKFSNFYRIDEFYIMNADTYSKRYINAYYKKSKSKLSLDEIRKTRESIFKVIDDKFYYQLPRKIENSKSCENLKLKWEKSSPKDDSMNFRSFINYYFPFLNFYY